MDTKSALLTNREHIEAQITLVQRTIVAARNVQLAATAHVALLEASERNLQTKLKETR